MSRSCNFNTNGGILAGVYFVRFCYQPVERAAIENVVSAWLASNPSCGYSYKYPVSNGFYWFKNFGSNYITLQTMMERN